MKRPPVIAVDVDEVCADMIPEWVRRYNLITKDALLPEMITSWAITEHMPLLAPEEVYELLGAPDFYDYVKPLPGARSTVEELRKIGRVLFVTACHPNTMGQKFRWLERWGFLRDQKDFIAAKDKALIAADVLFDDCVANVEAFPNDAFLVPHTHNAMTMCTRERLKSFSDAPEALRQMQLV